MNFLLKITALVLVAGAFMCGCTKNYDPIKVGAVLTVDGPGDGSFNDNVLVALERSRVDYNISFDYKVPSSAAEVASLLEYFARNNYDLIIATGFLMHDACESVADKYPNTDFAIIDSNVQKSNVKPLLFDEYEAAFVAGAVSARVSQSGRVGFIGGMELPFIKKIYHYYDLGVKYQSESVEVSLVYLTGGNSFNDPLQGKKEAERLINEGVDVIFHIAGNSSVGVVQACTEKEAWTIGEKGLNSSADDTVLAEIVRNPENAVYTLVEAKLKGKFDSSPLYSGINQNGISIEFYPYRKGQDVNGIQEIVVGATDVLLSGSVDIVD